MALKRKLVALVTTDILTPYKKDEIFCVSEEDAVKLETVDRSKNEYGVPRNPRVKVVRFDPNNEKHQELLLQNSSLNLEDHNRLLKRLHPERPAVEVRMTQYESEITSMLDEIDPERGRTTQEKLKEANREAEVGAHAKSKEDGGTEYETAESEKAAQGGGLRARRGRPSKQ